MCFRWVIFIFIFFFCSLLILFVFYLFFIFMFKCTVALNTFTVCFVQPSLPSVSRTHSHLVWWKSRQSWVVPGNHQSPWLKSTGVWLTFSLSIVSLRFTHIVAWVSTALILRSRLPLYAQATFSLSIHLLTTHSPSCSSTLTIVSRTATKLCIQLLSPLSPCFHFLIVQTQKWNFWITWKF